MLKKQTYIYQCLSLFILIIAIMACSDSQSTKINECEKSDNGCLKLNSKEVLVKFNTDYLLVETPYKLTVKSKQPISKISLKGITMNMGTVNIPLTKAGGDLYQGTVMLGMCSEPRMKWQLTVQNGNATLSEFEVTSYWSKGFVD